MLQQQSKSNLKILEYLLLCTGEMKDHDLHSASYLLPVTVEGTKRVKFVLRLLSFSAFLHRTRAVHGGPHFLQRSRLPSENFH